MAKIKSSLVVAFVVIFLFNAVVSEAPKICGESDGDETTFWNGDCAGRQTFAVKEKKLVVRFDYSGSAGGDQNINFNIGGCRFTVAFYYSTKARVAIFSINDDDIRNLPLTAEITSSKIVFKKEGKMYATTINCRPKFNAVAGSSASFKISVKYDPEKPGQLNDLKMNYEAPIFVHSESSLASSPSLWSGVSLFIFVLALVIGVICGVLCYVSGKCDCLKKGSPTKIKAESKKRSKKGERKDEPPNSWNQKLLPSFNNSKENVNPNEKIQSKEKLPNADENGEVTCLDPPGADEIEDEAARQRLRERERERKALEAKTPDQPVHQFPQP